MKIRLSLRNPASLSVAFGTRKFTAGRTGKAVHVSHTNLIPSGESFSDKGMGTNNAIFSHYTVIYTAKVKPIGKFYNFYNYLIVSKEWS